MILHIFCNSTYNVWCFIYDFIYLCPHFSLVKSRSKFIYIVHIFKKVLIHLLVPSFLAVVWGSLGCKLCWLSELDVLGPIPFGESLKSWYTWYYFNIPWQIRISWDIFEIFVGDWVEEKYGCSSYSMKIQQVITTEMYLFYCALEWQ